METIQDNDLKMLLVPTDDNIFSCGLLILIEQFLLKNVDLELKVSDLKCLRLLNRYLYGLIPLSTLIHFPNKKMNLDFSCILDKSLSEELNESLDQAIPCYDYVPNIKGKDLKFVKVFKKDNFDNSEWYFKTKIGVDRDNTFLKMIRNEDLPRNQNHNILTWLRSEMNKLDQNTHLMIESSHLSKSLIPKQCIDNYLFPQCYILVFKNKHCGFEKNIMFPTWHDFRFIFDSKPHEFPIQHHVVEKRGIQNLEVIEYKSKIPKLASTTKRSKAKLKFDSDSKPKFNADIKIYHNYKISDGKEKFNIKIFANPETKQFTSFYDQENYFDKLFYSNLNIPDSILQKLETKFQFTKIKINSHQSHNMCCSKLLAYKYCLASLILNHTPIWTFILEFKDFKLELKLHYEDRVLEQLQFKESKHLSLQYLVHCNGKSIFNVDFAAEAYKIYFNFEKRICHIIDTDFSESEQIRIVSIPRSATFDGEIRKLTKTRSSFKGMMNYKILKILTNLSVS